MRSRRVAPLAALLCLFSSPAAADDLRLGRDVVPTYQEIDLVLDARKAEYEGTVAIDLTVARPVDSFAFHAEAMQLTSVVLTPLDARGGPVTLATEERETGYVRATAPAPLAPGTYRLDVAFTNDFSTQAQGLYRLDVAGEGYAFTQFESDDAREAFPCFDEPSFKFPYRMILTVPDEHLAVSNMPVENETRDGGMRRVVFAQSPPMPSYLLAIATGPLETVDIPGMPVPGRVITVKAQTHLTGEAVRCTPPLLAALEQYFGQPYPYPKLDLIAVPEFWPGAMENIGAITFADRILLIDPAAASVAQKRALASVNAHELAHMWFGNLVTMEWWDDLWLNEAFASWMGDRITDRVYPEYNLPVTELEGADAAMQADAQLATRAIRQPVDAGSNLLQSADVLAYNKGQSVLGMFETWLGEETFREGVLAYLREHQWKNAQGADLWNALERVSGKGVAEAMASFLDQPGLPLITAEVTPDRKIKLRQTRFLNYGTEAPEPQLWRTPVSLTYRDGEGLRSASALLTEREQILDVPVTGEIAWIHPNVEENGYYRWSVSPTMLATLAEDAPELMSTRERVGFVNNLGALLVAGRVAGDDYLKVAEHFLNDPEPEVLSAALGALGTVRAAFVPEDAEDEFAVYVRRALGPVLDRYGLTARDGEPEPVTLFRPELLGMLGGHGRDERVLAFAREQTDKYLEDPSSADAGFIGQAIRLTARNGDRALFDTFRARFESAQVPVERNRYLGGLGSFRDPALMDEALAYAMTGPLRPQEFFGIPMSMGQTETGGRKLWTWMTGNYETITKKIPPMFLIYMPYFAGGCSAERLAAAEAFFADPAHSVTGTEKELAKVREGVNDCVNLREREGPAVLAYLRSAASGGGAGGPARR